MTSLDRTSRIVRAARDGDPDGLEQLVHRFSPWLMVQARFRLQGQLQRLCEPADLVDDVWLVALPRLAGLKPRDGRITPVIVRFLGTTLLNRLRALIERHLRTRPRTQRGLETEAPAGPVSVGRLPASVTDALSGAVLREREAMLWDAVRQLAPREQQLIVLRGLEQHPLTEVAALLGITTNHASVAYRRACARLRARLDPSLVRDLRED